ncbi:type B 50S ribosomal protein L31 [Streptomyces enissocaesilis]|uniref:Large ribosomal subunit protein bL31B n=1 Tax=Streptomyces enissocaesilis TaxID=332589 RepID=A0ABN3XCE9_9ACTN
MKPDASISYHEVVFRDRAAGYAFLTRSTATSENTIEWDDGSTYPVVDVEISSESHPFYTGRARTLDAEGRIAQFERRFGQEGKGEQEGKSGQGGNVGQDGRGGSAGQGQSPG